MLLRCIGVGVALLALSACSPVPVKTSGDWQAPDWTVWTLHGRVAIRHAEEGWHATLHWSQQSAVLYQLELSGPLGQGAVRLAGAAEGVRLLRADGVEDWAPTADELLARHTGWRLPIAGLRYWARGLPAPGSTASIERDPAGRPLRLMQAGWDIRYNQYQDYPGLGSLPRRVDFEHGELSARLIVDSWVVDEGAP